MSLRNIRKQFGGPELPPPNSDSEDDFAPLYSSKPPARFQNLVSNTTDTESENDLIEPEEKPQERKKKKKKNKKRHKDAQAGLPAVNDLKLDEIDKIILEVNAIAGTPEKCEVPASSCDLSKHFMTVSYKYLNANAELEKLLGPADDEGRRRRHHGHVSKVRRGIVFSFKDEIFTSFRGLSMSVLRQENGYTYYVFDHSSHYQKIHKQYLALSQNRTPSEKLSINMAHKNMNVESLIELADTMYRFEEVSHGNELIEQTLAYMQYAAHHTFSLTNPKTRLEYKYMENRPFHIALLKYIYITTTKACHRTALEMAKVLMNLDPSDPLAVVLIIDTLAIRAREYQWLLDAFEVWSKDRDAGLLFNMLYSCALAQYHLSVKAKEDLTSADRMLKDAMLRFPKLYVDIVDLAKAKLTKDVANSEFFINSHKWTSSALKDLMSLYAQLAWTRFREPGVFEWMMRNAEELAADYKTNPDTKQRAKEYADVRYGTFRSYPKEIIRHLTITRQKPMSDMNEQQGMERESWLSRVSDPAPPADTVDRYEYRAAVTPGTVDPNTISLIVASMMPNYDPDAPVAQQNMQGQALDALGAEHDLGVMDEGRRYAELDEGVMLRIMALAEQELGGHAEIPGIMDRINRFIHRMYRDGYGAGAGVGRDADHADDGDSDDDSDH